MCQVLYVQLKATQSLQQQQSWWFQNTSIFSTKLGSGTAKNSSVKCSLWWMSFASKSFRMSTTCHELVRWFGCHQDARTQELSPFGYDDPQCPLAAKILPSWAGDSDRLCDSIPETERSWKKTKHVDWLWLTLTDIGMGAAPMSRQLQHDSSERLAMSKTTRKISKTPTQPTQEECSGFLSVDECNCTSKKARFGSACRPKPDWQGQGSICRATPAQGSPNATSTAKQCHHISPGDAVFHHCYQRCDCLTALVTKEQDYLIITSTDVM